MKQCCLAVIVLISFLFTACSKKTVANESQKTKLLFLTEEYAPMNFSKKGKAKGMAVDVVNAICKELGIKSEIKVQIWKEAYHTALNTSNVILFSTTKINLREDKFYWLKPSIMKYKEYFYEKRGRNITMKKLEDAKRYKIGTTTEFSSEQYLESKGFTNLVSFSTQEETMQALIDGTVDLVVFASFRAEVLTKYFDYSISDILPVYKIRDAHLYITISKGTSEKIVREWQDAFDTIREDKTYFKIYKKWFFSHSF